MGIKSNQKTKDEPVTELDQYKHGKSNQKSVGEHGGKSRRTENASPARDRGKISQPLKNSKSKDDKRSTKVRGKVDTYFFHQTAVSVAVAPSACNITDQTKPTSNIVTKDVEVVEEVKEIDPQNQEKKMEEEMPSQLDKEIEKTDELISEKKSESAASEAVETENESKS